MIETNLTKGAYNSLSILAKIGGKDETNVQAISTGSDTISIDDAFEPNIAIGEVIDLVDHPDEGEYTVSGKSTSGGLVEISVQEDITDPTVKGYVLIPWDLDNDFDDVEAAVAVFPDWSVNDIDELRTQVRLTESPNVVKTGVSSQMAYDKLAYIEDAKPPLIPKASWSQSGGGITLNDGDGTNDKITISITSSDLSDLPETEYYFGIKGVAGGGEKIMVIPRGDITIILNQDVG